jgi:hypothetical protein
MRIFPTKRCFGKRQAKEAKPHGLGTSCEELWFCVCNDRLERVWLALYCTY